MSRIEQAFEDYYDSEDFFSNARYLSDNEQASNTMLNLLETIRQACRNIFGGYLANKMTTSAKCHIYMDHCKLQDIEDSLRVIAVSINTNEGSGELWFVDQEGFTFDFDNLDTDTLVSMTEQLLKSIQ